MRIAKNLLLVAAMLLMLSGVSQAAFDNSHHDMRSFTGTTKEGCLQCHGRQSAQTFTGTTTSLGNVGGLCLQRCHSGAGIIASLGQVVPQAPVTVNDQNYTAAVRPTANYNIVFFDVSHGNTPALLANGGWTGATAVTWPPATANTWPYMGASVAQIECTSCHAVHDNLNAPFLWAPLGPTSVGTATGFCDRCHSESARSGNFLTNAPNGNHPINFIVDNVAAAARTDANGRHGRRIVFQTYNALNVFDVPNPAASAMVGAPSGTTDWETGGHLVIPAAAATQSTTAMPTVGTGTTTAAMGCYTCHSAHKTSAYGENNLVNVVTVDNTGTWSPLCVGCHGPATSLAADQNEAAIGSLTQYGHPVGSAAVPAAGLYTTTIGGFKFAVNTGVAFTNRENNVGWGTGNALLCTTCHQVHGGATGSMALANIGQTTTTAICKQCHNGVGIPNVHDASKGGNLGDATTNRANLANAHHVTATTVSNGMGKTGDTGTVLYVNTSPSWAGTITRAPNLGVLTSGGMDCADCHTFNGTAHNW